MEKGLSKAEIIYNAKCYILYTFQGLENENKLVISKGLVQTINI